MDITSETSPGGNPMSAVFIFNWTPNDLPLARQLFTALHAEGKPAKVYCVVDPSAPADPMPRTRADDVSTDQPSGLAFRSMGRLDGEHCAAELRAMPLAGSRAIVVLPPRHVDDPDGHTRVLCEALDRARRVEGVEPPPLVVELLDPEARREFEHIAHCTVFSSGMLDATMLAQACVDLGAYAVLTRLLRRDVFIRNVETPEEFHGQTFRKAVLDLQRLDGQPVTVVGLQEGYMGPLILNPSPRTTISEQHRLLVLVQR